MGPWGWQTCIGLASHLCSWLCLPIPVPKALGLCWGSQDTRLGLGVCVRGSGPLVPQGISRSAQGPGACGAPPLP